MRPLASLLLCLSLSSCASYWKDSASSATTGAVSAISSPAVKTQLSGVATTTVAAARDEALGQKTTTALLTLRDNVLGPGLQQDAAQIRETLVGQPFRDDLNAAIDSASPHLQQAIQSGISSATLTVKSDVDQELPKLERILYVVLAVVGGAIALILLILCVIVYETHQHRKALERRSHE